MSEQQNDAPDAWKQLHDLLGANTTSLDVRHDLSVTAHGCNRSVELNLAYHTDDVGMRRWHSTGERNVGTMRELAQALLDACDFVEQVNPTWAVNCV